MLTARLPYLLMYSQVATTAYKFGRRRTDTRTLSSLSLAPPRPDVPQPSIVAAIRGPKGNNYFHSTAPAFSYRSFHVATLTSMRETVSGADMLQSFEGGSVLGLNAAQAMRNFIDCDAVAFDVDSTVVSEEGIDVLAAYLGQGEQVADVTRQAMEGGMKFQEALQMRLDLLKPSKSHIEECLQQHPLKLTPGIKELVGLLHDQGKHVYLVSGGFRIMIEPVAKELQIPNERIYANTLRFDDDGNYRDFDPDEPTSRDMGKPEALQQIEQTGGYKMMVMVGDGATDAQAKPPAVSFIGFGGVARRERVLELADWFVTDFGEMIHLLEKFGQK